VGRSGIAVVAVAAAFAVVPSAHAATAYFSVTPDAALIGTVFVFDATGSQGVRFQWDLDGEPGYELDTGPSQQASKSYTGPGTMTARLLVTDLDGFTAEFTQTFTVLAPSIPEPIQEDVTPPVISGVKITPTAFRLALKTTPINAVITKKKAPRGGRLTWTLSEPANLAVYIERCASKKSCNPHVVTVKMHRTVPAGTRSMPFTGRVELRRLSPGGYRFKLTATDASENFSATKYAQFIVAPG
jgi:PKD repeat protein